MPVPTTSEPAITEEVVTDIDLVLSSGRIAGFTLRSGDAIKRTDDAIIIDIIDRPNLTHQEHAIFYRAHIASTIERIRVEKRADPAWMEDQIRQMTESAAPPPVAGPAKPTRRRKPVPTV